MQQACPQSQSHAASSSERIDAAAQRPAQAHSSEYSGEPNSPHGLQAPPRAHSTESPTPMPKQADDDLTTNFFPEIGDDPEESIDLFPAIGDDPEELIDSSYKCR